jgi:uncharacterized membrane protein
MEPAMNSNVEDLARKLLQSGHDELSDAEQQVIAAIADRSRISKDINETFRDKLTFGERMADTVARFGGSWRFIGLFGLLLAAWVIANVVLLPKDDAFDPYPFIFLNLMLSMLAAIQAPVIMMSQNRYAAKDRMAAAHDYEVNLKAELEIMALHEKVDDLRMAKMTALLGAQNQQIEMIKGIVERLDGGRR